MALQKPGKSSNVQERKSVGKNEDYLRTEGTEGTAPGAQMWGDPGRQGAGREERRQRKALGSPQGYRSAVSPSPGPTLLTSVRPTEGTACVQTGGQRFRGRSSWQEPESLHPRASALPARPPSPPPRGWHCLAGFPLGPRGL